MNNNEIDKILKYKLEIIYFIKCSKLIFFICKSLICRSIVMSKLCI